MIILGHSSPSVSGRMAAENIGELHFRPTRQVYRIKFVEIKDLSFIITGAGPSDLI